MPFLIRDLGFSNLVTLFFVLLATISAFVVRSKWRIAAARKEEIMRLRILASEEAARAELEAAAEYGSVVVSAAARQQCAVCYCPTTTRCSRCKAVRYCSGKCQIIHWRQGHKEECSPPTSAVPLNDTGSDSDSTSVLHGKQSDIEHVSLGAEEDSQAKPIQGSHERPTTSESSCSFTVLDGNADVKTRPPVDVTGADPSNVTLSAAGGVASTLPEELRASSVHENPLSSSSILKGPLSDEISHDNPRSKTDVVHNKTKSQTSKGPVPAVATVDTFSCPSKLKQKTPSKSNETVDHESSSSSGSGFTSTDECSVIAPSPAECPNATINSGGTRTADHDNFTRSSFRDGGDSAQSDSGLRFSFNLSRQSAPSVLSTCSNPKTLVCDSSHFSSLADGMPRASPSGNIATEKPPTLGSEELSSITKERSGEKRLLKSSGAMPLSYGASSERASSGARCSTSSVTSAKVDTVRTVPLSCETTNSTPNGSNSLKTSMRKVVQQFKPSKLSKHHPLGLGSEIASKYKMLFPYDLFIKLYNAEKVELRPSGLVNCGNSCYANAVLQCLTFTRPLTAYLLQGYHTKSCPKKEWCFTCELESLVLQAKEGKSPISPIRILSQIQNIGGHLGHGREEDAHEFLRYAIDTMQSVCLKEAGVNAEAPMAEETTLMQLIFGGFLRSKIQCMKCQGKSERHERMMDLTVEIHGDIGTLEEALHRFTATEILDGDNKYHCGRCKSYEKAKKKLTVSEAPNILTIALKRFQSGKFGKLNKSVRFPEVLDLAPYMRGTDDKSPIYSLYAVVVHLDIMNAAFSGHYVCYVKNPQGKWFKMDDSKVKPVELDRVLTKTAYMLLYARCSPRAPSTIRNAMSHAHVKNKRSKWMEAIPSSHSERSTSRGRPIPSVSSSAGSSEAFPRPEVYPYWTAVDRPTFESPDSLDGGFYPVYRIPKTDSSSDNSSLLSCSDEGSCSTESTRDSTSTDEYSEYIFGDTGIFSWNSPISALEDSDVSYPPPLYRSSPLTAFKTMHVSTSLEQRKERREVSLGKESSPFLYSDTSRQSRKLTDHCSSSGTDWEQLGRVNPSDAKSGGVSLRRPWEKATQTFY